MTRKNKRKSRNVFSPFVSFGYRSIKAFAPVHWLSPRFSRVRHCTALTLHTVVYTPSGRCKNGRGDIDQRWPDESKCVLIGTFLKTSTESRFADGRKIERDSLTNRFSSDVDVFFVLRRDEAHRNTTMNRRRFSVRRISRVH